MEPYEAIGTLADPSQLRVTAAVPEGDMTRVGLGRR